MLAALAIMGCASATEPDQGLDVLVALSSEVIHPGEPIEVTVTATNRGTRSVTINGYPCRGALGAFVVTNTDGDVVGPGETLCPLVAFPPKQVAPGEQIVFRSTWDGDSQRSRFNGPSAYLDQGEYHLQGQILTSFERVLSPPVTVRVVR